MSPIRTFKKIKALIMKKLIVFLTLSLVGMGCQNAHQEVRTSDYLDYSNSPSKSTGGTTMIDVSTALGTFKVWTKRDGVNEVTVPLEAGRKFYRFALQDDIRRGGLHRGPVKGSRDSLGIFHRIGNEDSVDDVDNSVGGFDIGFYNLCVIHI